jgi:hypothetical protein
MNNNIKPYVPISNFPLKLACVYSNYSSNLPKKIDKPNLNDICVICDTSELSIVIFKPMLEYLIKKILLIVKKI